MDLKQTGVIIVLILAILQIVGWLSGQDGLLTASIISIIAGIVGVIFGIKITIWRNK